MMAALICKAISFRFTPGMFVTSHQIVRNHWNKDWQPAEFPTTKEERELSAKKYGVHPTKYEVYEDDGTGFGDYPKLPDISAESKDPFYPWDFPEAKRNFNEPMHINADQIGEDRLDVSQKPKYNQWLKLGLCTGVIFGFYAVYILVDEYRWCQPLLPKQYPKSGVHYTFEPRS